MEHSLEQVFSYYHFFIIGVKKYTQRGNVT